MCFLRRDLLKMVGEGGASSYDIIFKLCIGLTKVIFYTTL